MSNQQRIVQIKALLEQALSPSLIDVQDESHKHIGHAGAQNGAGHFALTIQSAKLANKNRLQQHKIIYEILAEMMQNEIHALKIKVLQEIK